MSAADRLRELASNATPGPWEATDPSSFHTTELRAPSPYNGFALIKVMTNRDADLALIALAPELARGYADALDALAMIRHDPDWPAMSQFLTIGQKDRVDAVLADADRLLGNA